MKQILLYPIGSAEATRFAVSQLHKKGIPLIDHPAPEVTHLLLDTPGFTDDGKLHGGAEVEKYLERLPPEITVVGGNLDQPSLQDYRTVDFLTDEGYLAKNAAITAECALQFAANYMETTFADTKTLIIGWGRIGKCLARLLRGMGADITVAARKERDRAILTALGYRAVDFSASSLPCQLVFNTVPQPIFQESEFPCSCLKIDLASRPGLLGEDVISGRGLPGKYAPESSGQLIAETFLRLCKEGSK